MRTAEIRRKFLDFFAGKGHLVLPSDSLVPNDPTLLFTSAGMVQFKPYFLGATPRFAGHPGVHRRVATAQKCLRVGDIESVGRTARHNSFFEMLGNFSFGDYFKLEAAEWGWEFLVSDEWLGLDPDRLQVSVYRDDDEAADVWTRHVGLPAAKVSRFDADENFWPANAPKEGPNGPCGPCSEIFYDRGPEFGGPADTGPNTGTGDRFVEIWNLVFTQFDRRDGGKLEPLPQRNIDTGAGLTRIAPILQGVADFYEIDECKPLVDQVIEFSGRPYQGIESVSHRVIADHARGVTFAMTDGVKLANSGRGYVIRRLLRRAVRHGWLLGIREPFMWRLVEVVDQMMGQHYTELGRARPMVEMLVRAEEERFLATLADGMKRLNQVIRPVGIPSEERSGTPAVRQVRGDDAFLLYDTFGFPIDLTIEIAAERGATVDLEGFSARLKEQQERARAAMSFTGDIFERVEATIDAVAGEYGETQFVGYERLEAPATVLALVPGEGRTQTLVVDLTPFYATAGGQVADVGLVEWAGGRAIVTDVRRSPQGLYLHTIELQRGELALGRPVTMRVDPARRDVERHHTATHLLHAALRRELGEHVTQAGSEVRADGFRFDFTHPEGLPPDRLAAVEKLVNRWVMDDRPVVTRLLPLAEARAAGAMALFGEKYGAVVRVVSVEGGEPVSIELCGGTHVRHTGEIGYVHLAGEAALGAGVRRLEVVAGPAAVAHAREAAGEAQRAALLLNTSPSELGVRIARLQAELKETRRQVHELQARLAAARTGAATEGGVREAGNVRYATLSIDGLEANALRTAADKLLAQSKADLVVVVSGTSVVAKASKDAVSRGVAAGKVVGALTQALGGRGGGRPEMAQGGFKEAVAAERLEEALRVALAAVKA
jgi:alanyl-tRNA synthetase